MDRQLAGIFLYEIERVSRYALSSIGEFNSLLEARDGGADELIRKIDEVVADAGRIAQMLWPHKQGNSARGAYLRRVLEVPEDSPIKDKSLRNSLEHFDERIEAWAASSRRRNFVDLTFGPENTVGGVEPSDIMRHYLPDRHVYRFRGDEFDIQKLVAALADVNAAAKQLTSGHWNSLPD